ncbi:DapH/DapD/GlmU-related protein [Brasilonema sp. UFV-L1]|uniref:serine O-acetyltransferase n=1 Tax=Brasilonema sp. UFV-L1 TaxID=2234130 RepID=UPI00145FABD2|nr:DapH/DapD/GlmU-related protein [Brasilonema sp. UFV-L1]NMG07194.1 serine acetyltransferase [Brasilonema sp. UFV-L1]
MINYLNYILQDWQVNKETSSKSRFILLMFRSTKIFGLLPGPFSLFSSFYRGFYQLLIEWILGVELPWNTQIGANLKLLHCHALVVNHETIIGMNCTLRHSTTIGNKILPDGTASGSPKIGNNVEIGSNVVIIGPITVGDHAVIGAGSVVVKDVPSCSVVVGNPARVIRTLNTTLSFINNESQQAEELASVSSQHQ